MDTIFKFEQVVQVKEMNEKFRQVGNVYEIANILEDAFVLRSADTRVAVGVVSFEDFNKYFVKKDEFKGWTNWTFFVGFDGQNDCMYRTNLKKTQVMFLTSKVRAESCCNNKDVFNLSSGIHFAYLRCLNKAWEKKKDNCADADELKKINAEIAENEMILKRMINAMPI